MKRKVSKTRQDTSQEPGGCRGNSELVTVREIAREYQVAEKTIYGWKAIRKIPYIKVGRCLRFDRSAVRDFILSKSNQGEKI